MCGGFVAFYAGTGDGRAGLSHAAYNLGRLAAYAVLGALAGALGVALDPRGPHRRPARGGRDGGAPHRALGNARFSRPRGAHGKSPAAVRPQRCRGRGVARVARQPPATRALVVGLLTGFLPCGWLYAFVVTAAGTGGPSPRRGMMAVFWPGPCPSWRVSAWPQAMAGRSGDSYLPRVPSP